MARKTSSRAALVEGVYEHLVTEELEGALAGTGMRALVERLEEDAPDLHVVFAAHLAREIARALTTLPREDRVEQARAIAARVLEEVAEMVKEDAAEGVREQVPVAPARRLLSVHRGEAPARPATPLAISTLLTRNRAEPSFGHELAR